MTFDLFCLVSVIDHEKMILFLEVVMQQKWELLKFSNSSLNFPIYDLLTTKLVIFKMLRLVMVTDYGEEILLLGVQSIAKTCFMQQSLLF